MKRLILVASLALVAVVVAPVASANAEQTFVGACLIEGNATFEEGKLALKIPAPNKYNFQSTLTECAKVTETELLEIKHEIEEVATAASKGEVAVAEKKLKEVVARLQAKPIKETGNANVNGRGLLSCPLSIGGFENGTFAPGTGKIEVPSPGPSAEFLFRFVAQGGIVDFQAAPKSTGLYTAVGAATFLANEKARNECGPTSTEGPEKLPFVAVTAGVI